MKKISYFLIVMCFSDFASAQLIRKTEPVDFRATKTEAQIEVGQYRPQEKEINYILGHYTDGELRNYARALNMQEIETARANGEKIPEKLSEETLKSREKIGEYLRSYFKLPY